MTRSQVTDWAWTFAHNVSVWLALEEAYTRGYNDGVEATVEAERRWEAL